MPKVLIADNDRAVSNLLTDVLQRAGLDVEHAFDGPAAHQLARRPDLRVLVCDLDMPGMSGIEVVESLLELPAPPAVVIVSGWLDAPLENRLARLPYVRSTLRKPFDLMRFADLIQDLVRTAAAGGAAGPAAGGQLQGEKITPRQP